MSQCVPGWDIDDPPNQVPVIQHHSPSATAHVLTPIPLGDSEVAELTWENGHIAMSGLARMVKPSQPAVVSTLAVKPRAHVVAGAGVGGGTLEAVVDQATRVAATPNPLFLQNDLAAWLTSNQLCPSSPAMDALVPCAIPAKTAAENTATRVIASSTASGGSCGRKRARATAGTDQASQGSAGGWGRGATLDTYDDAGFTTTSASPSLQDGDGDAIRSLDTENTSFGGGGDSIGNSRRSQRDVGGDDDEKVSNGETGKSTVSTKRSRAAAVHNQSERKRRDRINQKMRTLQKLVPNSSKSDKASVLDEVIDYMKQLQAQVHMMSSCRMGGIPSPMMMPMAMQQLQMAMMANMAQMAQMAQIPMMGGMGMPTGTHALPTQPPPPQPPPPPPSYFPTSGMLNPAAFLQMAAGTPSLRDATNDRRMQTSTTAATSFPAPDILSSFMPCPTQPMGMDGYSRMAAMYQQLHQQSQGNNPT